MGEIWNSFMMISQNFILFFCLVLMSSPLFQKWPGLVIYCSQEWKGQVFPFHKQKYGHEWNITIYRKACKIKNARILSMLKYLWPERVHVWYALFQCSRVQPLSHFISCTHIKNVHFNPQKITIYINKLFKGNSQYWSWNIRKCIFIRWCI